MKPTNKKSDKKNAAKVVAAKDLESVAGGRGLGGSGQDFLASLEARNPGVYSGWVADDGSAFAMNQVTGGTIVRDTDGYARASAQPAPVASEEQAEFWPSDE